MLRATTASAHSSQQHAIGLAAAAPASQPAPGEARIQDAYGSSY